MGTADKIALMYTMDRANFSAFSAGNTFIVINSCEVINDPNSLGGTNFFALTASDTAVLTELAYLYTLIVIIALNDNACNVVNKVDYSVRAGALAKTAADTFLGVDFGNSALGNRDSISWAYLSAVTVTEAGEGTESVTREAHICRLAGLRT